MRAFVQGEVLCDAGNLDEGMALLKRANHLAWELDSADWPTWANVLYERLGSDAPPPSPPPLLGAQGPQCSATERFVPEALRLPQRWGSPQGLGAVSSALAAQNFCVIDGLAGADVARTFRAACHERWHANNLFQPAHVTGPGGSTTGSRSALARSDHIAWVDHTQAAEPDADPLLTSLQAVVACVDRLVRALAADAASAGDHVTRQRPQIARYGEGEGFTRHCDNYCPVGGGGPHCNGRWLTAVYYSSDGWLPGDGGCLRLYQPQVDALDHETGELQDTSRDVPSATEDDALVDVAPLADRLLLFYSDYRCPHEVLPVAAGSAARYAATVWFNRQPAHGTDLITTPQSGTRLESTRPSRERSAMSHEASP